MSKRSSRNSILALLSLVLAAAGHAEAARIEETREPIVITAESMKAVELKGEIEFTGNVLMKKEGTTITSDEATVYYDEQAKGIQEIEARGNVVVRKEGRVAHSQRARYYSREEKVILTGEARILENENELGGDRITIFLRDDRSIIEGGKVLFYQDAAPAPKQSPEGEKGKTAPAEHTPVKPE